MTHAATALPAPDVTDRGFWDAPRVTDALAPVALDAEAEHGTPWPQPLTSHYARFFRDGNRTAYEDLVAARQARLTRAVLTALRTRETRWVDEVVDGLVLLCEQSSWCWAAHDDTRARYGRVTPTVTDPYLDLGAGEVAAQLAWTDHLLGPLIDERAPGVRERLRVEATARVLRPFVERRDWWWLGVDHPIMNWSPWIHGNVLAATLVLERDADRRERTVTLVADGLAAYWASLPADGGVDEGYQYWWQGAARALEAQDLLGWATGAPLGAASLPTVRATVAFPHSMHLGGDWYLNVADGTARPPARYPWNVLHSWAVRLGDRDAARHAASYRGSPGLLLDDRASLARAVVQLADERWAATARVAPPLVAQVWLPQTQLALAREAAGTAAGLTVSVKGGHNDENHNHDDVGSVVVALDGVPVVVDAGRVEYSAATFGPDRYSIWALRGDWHNVPRVRGVEQPPGRDLAARAMSVVQGARDGHEHEHERGAGRWLARLDLAGAYPVPDLETWWREVALDRAAGRVTVRDSWSFGPRRDDPGQDDPGGVAAGSGATAPAPAGDGRTAWHWVLAGEVTPAEGRATVRHRARTLLMTWDSTAVDADLEVRELDDPHLTAVWGARLTRLRLTLRAETPHGTFCVTMCPAPDTEEVR